MSRQHICDEESKLTVVTDENGSRVVGYNLTTTYTYDLSGHIKKETKTGSEDISYTYDSNNNRKEMKAGNKVTAYKYNKNDELLRTDTLNTDTEEDSVVIYKNDKNGNQLATVNRYAIPSDKRDKPYIDIDVTLGDNRLNENVVNHYNAENQLIQTLTKNYKVSFTYDAEGLRTSKTVNGEKTVFVWDGDQLVMELSESGKVKKRYVRGNDLVYLDKGGGNASGEGNASREASEKQYYVTDPHGNVVQLTDEKGKVTKTYEYDSFGNEVKPDSKDDNPFRYCGEYYDKETEEVYLRARYYQPAAGRFLTRDTYTGEEDEPLSLHLYAYCGNDGVNSVDPSGHFWKKIVNGIKDGFIDTYKGVVESVKHPIRTIKEQFKPKNILKNALDPMGFGRLWYGFGKAAINKDTYTIGYLYGGQLGEASLVLIGEGSAKGIGKASKVLSKGKPPVVKKALNKVKKVIRNKSPKKLKKKLSISKKNYLKTIDKLDDLFIDVNRLSEVSGKRMYKFLSKKGYDIRPLSRGSLKGKPFKQGGGFKINWGGDKILQYHPAKGSHHGGAYYKLSSGKTGTIRVNIK